MCQRAAAARPPRGSAAPPAGRAAHAPGAQRRTHLRGLQKPHVSGHVVTKEKSLPSGRTCQETRGCWAGTAAWPRGVRKTDLDFHGPSGNTPCLPKSSFPDSRLAPRHMCFRPRGKSPSWGSVRTPGGLSWPLGVFSVSCGLGDPHLAWTAQGKRVFTSLSPISL